MPFSNHISDFRAHLLGVSCLAISTVAGGCLVQSVSKAETQYNYLYQLRSTPVNQNQILWESNNIKFEEKLDQTDKDQIARILATADRGQKYVFDRVPFSGSALDYVNSTNCGENENSCSITLRLNRSLKPEFVHGDSRIIEISETSLRMDIQANSTTTSLDIQNIAQEERAMRFYRTQVGWVQSFVQTKSASKFLWPRANDINVAGRLSGLNYYPSSAPWGEFWSEFPQEDINQDLDNISELGANAVRIFLNHAFFTDPNTRETAFQRLEYFLEQCSQKGIGVLVTLFDLRPDYSLDHWEEDARHVAEVLDRVGQNSALIGIDIKNQPDLDFEGQGKDLVTGWLQSMAVVVKRTAPHVPVTIGWSEAQKASTLIEFVDVVSYHDYKPVDGFAVRFDEVSAAAKDKPVFITEIGATVWKPPFPRGWNEARQAKRLQVQLSHARNADAIFLWTLNDFDAVGPNVVGPLPWRQKQQQHFGLLDQKGQARPSAEIYSRFNAEFLGPNTQQEK